MKKNFFIVLVTVFSVALASHSVIGSLLPRVGSIFTWESTSYDFGKVKLNKPVEHEFSFRNTGDQPLIISKVKASCGCTVANYTKEPIAPGEYGKVSARYDAAKVGTFNKTVSVTANTGNEVVVLKINGEVISE